MDKTRTVGQTWLDNELDLSFNAIKKCSKAQSNAIIFSKFIVFIGDRQTIPDVKTVFSHSRGLKTWRFDKNWVNDFSHKTNTFSYDENVKKLVMVQGRVS